MSADRKRADLLLVERGHFESRARAQEAIRAGLVQADGLPVMRSSDRLKPDARIDAAAAHPFVSRGGVKLTAALDAFSLDPTACLCLDVGASTGGFSDVLLRRGAREVIAVDVGHGQLHPSMRADPRVMALEGTDIRSLDRRSMPGAPCFATIDVSFISLRLVLPAVVGLIAPEGVLVALIKPQFEVGRDGIGRGGLVRDEAAQEAVRTEMETFVRALGLCVLGTIASPIAGGDGNREFLLAARKGDAVE